MLGTRGCLSVFFFNDTATTEIYTLSLHDALPISGAGDRARRDAAAGHGQQRLRRGADELEVLEVEEVRSEEHTSELQSRLHLVCRLLLEKKKTSKTLRIPRTYRQMSVSS